MAKIRGREQNNKIKCFSNFTDGDQDTAPSVSNSS